MTLTSQDTEQGIASKQMISQNLAKGIAPDADFNLQLGFSFAMFVRHLANNPKLLQDFYRQKVEAPALKIAEPLEKSPCIEIPRIKESDIPPGGFQELFNFPVPLVIEGFATGSEAVQTWSPEHFRDQHGDIEIPYFKGKNYTQIEWCEMRDLIDDILSGGKERMYVNNIADIFHDIPGLQEQVPIAKFAKYMGNRKHNKTQIFLGGPSTGTGLHCANKFNLFVMVYGEKRWTFVHPKHSPWLYPASQKNFQFAYAPISLNFGHDTEAYPLIQYVPRYTTVLKPGDVLVNPPWWWHAVENLSPSSIGVATRWMTPWESIDGWKTNPLFSALEKLTLHYWKFAFKYYLLGIERRDSDGRIAH
jgi:Cupin-like domain